jgi:hypothetical protein
MPALGEPIDSSFAGLSAFVIAGLSIGWQKVLLLSTIVMKQEIKYRMYLKQ